MSKSAYGETWQATDAYFFDRLGLAFAKTEKDPVYSLLTANKKSRQLEKAAFFEALENGEEYQPDLTPDFDHKETFKTEIELLQVRQEIKSFSPISPEEEAVKDAYRWKINEMIAGLRMAEAAKRGDMRSFKAYNRFIYGSPDAELFNEEVESIKADARGFLNDPAKKTAAADVLEVLGTVGSAPVESHFTVTPELFASIKAAYRPVFDQALAGVEVPEIVEPEVGIKIVGRMLKNFGVDKPPHNYHPVFYDSTTASINHGSSEVRYPEKQIYPRPRFIGLFAGHEIFDHVVGRIRASRHSFKLAGKSLDRTEKASEGKGVAGEMSAYDSYEEFMAQERALTVGLRHLSVALALGVDGQPRNFSQVFKITEPIFRMYGFSENSKDTAWNLLSMRAMKGARGAGAAFQKEAVYAEGLRRYLILADAHPELMPYWNETRGDLSEPRHIQIFQTLGVLPSFS